MLLLLVQRMIRWQLERLRKIGMERHRMIELVQRTMGLRMKELRQLAKIVVLRKLVLMVQLRMIVLELGSCMATNAIRRHWRQR